MLEFILAALVVAIFIGLVLFFLSVLPFIFGIAAIIAAALIVFWIIYHLFKFTKNKAVPVIAKIFSGPKLIWKIGVFLIIIGYIFSLIGDDSVSSVAGIIFVAGLMLMFIWILFHGIWEKRIHKSVVDKKYLPPEPQQKNEKEDDPATKPVLMNKDGRMDAKKTILAIDDDRFLLNMYGAKYVQADFNAYTLTTANGDIVQKVIEIEPNLITLDIIMPGRDGMEALALLKKDERTKDIPIVMLTNQSDKEDIETAKNLGADDYIIMMETIPSEVVRKIINIFK